VVTGAGVPHYASSAMDGWLTVGPGPWRLTDSDPGPGDARAILTGALVTDRQAGVLRSEHAVLVEGIVHSTHPDEPWPGQHVRPVGSEALPGDTLVVAGRLLNPAHVALAASAGLDDLVVHARPGVAFVFTGDEIMTSGAPGPGLVRDSFGIQLPGLFELLGAVATRQTRVGDDREATVRALHDSDAPLIVTTGGTGTSSADHVRGAVAALGGRIIVDRVGMRPGGPTTLTVLPDGRLVACLPGNPLAAMIAAITICEPLIAGLSGGSTPALREIPAIDVAGRAGSTLLMPYTRVGDRIALSPWQGSGMVRGLADAHGILVVPPQGLTVEGRAESVDVPWATSDRAPKFWT